MIEEPSDWAQLERELGQIDWGGRARGLGLGGWGPPGSMEELECEGARPDGVKPFGREALRGLYRAVEWSLELSGAPKEWGEEWSERERGARAWGFLEKGLRQADEIFAKASPSGAKRIHPRRLGGDEGPMTGAQREAKERDALAEARAIGLAIERRRQERLENPCLGSPRDRQGEGGSESEGSDRVKGGRL